MREAIDRIVIVGGGVAAQRCAFALRRLGYERSLTMCAAEEQPPYDRTLLSKSMIVSRAALTPLRSLDSYREAEIELRLGTRAVELDIATSTVDLAGGESLGYDRVVIATGGRAVLPQRLDAPGVQTIRETADLDSLLATIDRASRLVIVGGGLIGGELASAMRQSTELEVTIVEATAGPLAPLLGADVAQRLAALHEGNGVSLVTEAAVDEIASSPAGYVLRLLDGRQLTADAVVVAVGMKPAVDWLRSTGLNLRDGVATDAYCRTDVPTVLAAGDCARAHHPRFGSRLRFEHWDAAARHGELAAANALDAGEPLDLVPFFWSDQHGVKLALAGDLAGWDEVEIEELPTGGAFTARYRRRGELTAIFSTADLRAVVAVRRALASRDPATAAPPEVPGRGVAMTDKEQEGGVDMTDVSVDHELCIGSGNCVHFLPAVFELDEEDLSTVIDPDAASIDELRAAAVQCPTGAISVKE